MPPIAAQLDQFRTETLGKYLPAEKKEAAEANSYMDSLIGLDNVQLAEVPVVNSRAGLYIYLSAAVSLCPFLRSVQFHADGLSSWGDL